MLIPLIAVLLTVLILLAFARNTHENLSGKAHHAREEILKSKQGGI